MDPARIEFRLRTRYLDEQAPLQNLVDRKTELASQIREQIDRRMRDGRTNSVPLADDLRLQATLQLGVVRPEFVHLVSGESGVGRRTAA